MIWTGTLCIPSDHQRMNDIEGSMRELRVNYAHLTPTVSRLLNPDDVPELETLQFSGEPLTGDDVARWRPKAFLLNTYGPAEATVTSTIARVDSTLRDQEPSIGLPHGSLAWIVHATFANRLVGPGETGELLLEGPLVGAGYYGDEAQSTAAFIDNPEWLARGASGFEGRRGRLYRTGDLVCQHADGSLRYVGRKDHQIKIHGQRVELGEIEHHVLSELELAYDRPFRVAVEVVKTSETAEPLLIAFLGVLEDIEDLSAYVTRITCDLASRLSAKLPQYLIPSRYIGVEQMPQTTSGKLDRRGLREMAASALREQTRYADTGIPTRGSLAEERLRQLWAQVLRLDDPLRVGLHDSFLNIGGDSLGAMKLVAAARELQLKLSVADVFRHPRLSDMARITGALRQAVTRVKPFSLLLREESVAGTSLNVMIQKTLARICDLEDPSRVEDAYPCTPLQQGLLALTAKRSGDYVARMAFDLLPDVDVNRLRNAWERTCSQFPILRSVIVNLPGHGMVQAVLDRTVQWEPYDSLDAYLDQSRAQLMGLETPLASAALIQGKQRSTQLILTMHHSIYDGWSIPLFSESLEAAYEGQLLPTVQPFQTFVEHIQNINEEEAKEHWEACFDGLQAGPFPSLPTSSYSPRSDERLHGTLRGISPPTGFTASTAIQVALGVLIAHHTNTDEALFGLVSSGRQADVQGIDRVAGPTISTVPIRMAVRPKDDIHGILSRVQSNLTEMTAFEQYGLQNIQQVSESARRACHFQTLLVVQPDQPMRHTVSPIFQSHSRTLIKDEADAFSTYAMLLHCEPHANHEVDIQVSFDSHVISQEYVQRLLWQLEAVLRQIGEIRPDTKLEDIQVASEQDLADIKRWTDKIPSPITDRSVHELFQITANGYADSPAICAHDGSLTYRELDRISTNLGRYLATIGVGPEVIVPVLFEKSVYTAVAVIGVMKAGGASVLLDAGLPLERLRSIVRQVQPLKVILSSTSKQKLAKTLEDSVVVVINRLSLQKLQDEAFQQRLPATQPNDLIYVVFTSGSTGVSLVTECI